jgi:HK97 gp10 family phage protein
MAKVRKLSSNLSIIGATEVIEMMKNMADEAEKIVDEAARKAATIVKEDATSKVKVVSGKLRDSIDIKPEKSKKKTKKTYRVYSKGVRQGGVRYAFAVEAGTSKMEAKPFLRPALDENKRNIINTVNETIGKGIDKAVR